MNLKKGVMSRFALTLGLVGASLAVLAETVVESAREIPLIEDVDVVVVGGGFSAVSAASEGKRVLVAEWLHVMGGTTTEGRIATYYHGNDRGFSKLQVDAGTRGNNAIGWVFSETKSEWFRRTAVAAGAELLQHRRRVSQQFRCGRPLLVCASSASRHLDREALESFACPCRGA